MRRVWRCAGAEAAFLIGSGFASGQEILQFFAAYGLARGLLGGLLAWGLLAWISVRVLTDAPGLGPGEKGHVFQLYCGRRIGAFLDGLTPLVLFGIYAVMVSGAGALVGEAWGVPPAVGRTAMLLAALGTVLLGLERLTDIIGAIGPVMILLVAAVSLAAVVRSPEPVFRAAELAPTLPIPRPAGPWWLSGILYAACNGYTLMPFLSGLSEQLPDRRSRFRAGAAGASAFGAAAILLQLGLTAWLKWVYAREVPAVCLAELLHPGLGRAFSALMLAGVYTTAVPALWTACSRLSAGRGRFGLWAVILTAAAGLCGRLSFAGLVNRVYPGIGWCGAAVLACMLARSGFCGRRSPPGGGKESGRFRRRTRRRSPQA